MQKRLEFWLVNYVFVAGFLLATGFAFWIAHGLWGYTFTRHKDLVQGKYVYDNALAYHTQASMYFKVATVSATAIIWSVVALLALAILYDGHIKPYLQRSERIGA